ncbi:nucleobase:cation symporter-2 family protein [Ornithinicoccus halotolerans]|uniref:nucleobase:cation symporter-2 family protein n=1 Tax=Ornithinicoccus halotolerans TaxID=1748220 RepID=UPI001295DDEF|nr:nucleobase:cation symporter-2 family protein [Ornithinicoccus halotolerans]
MAQQDPVAAASSPQRAAEAPVGQRPEDERLGIGRSLMYGLQHVLTMYGGVIAVPLIVGTAAGLSPNETAVLVASALFVGGAATILQSWGVPFFGSQLPLVQGVSFAGVATMLAILAGGGGLPAIFGAVLVAALVGLVLAPFFAKVIRFFPPVVTGTVITTIGLTLMPVAANWAMGGDPEAADYGSLANVGLAALTFVVVLGLSKVGSAAISRLSILLAIVIGAVVATAAGMTDFSGVGEGAPVAVPQPFAFGMPTFEVAAIISMTIVILVCMTETTADILAVGEIVRTRVSSRRIADGLRADMLSSAVAPVFNSFAQTAFAQNVGLVAITGIKSRFVVSAGGVVMLVLGLLPVLGQVVAAIPTPVLGGAGVVLFGTVAASGIRTLAKVDYEGTMNLVIVASSLAFGMIPIVSPSFYDNFPEWFGIIFHSGISSAAIMAVLLNVVFNEIAAGNRPRSSVFIARGARYISPEQLSCLREGDRVEGGKLVDCHGEEVPVVDTDGNPVTVTAPEAEGSRR